MVEAKRLFARFKPAYIKQLIYFVMVTIYVMKKTFIGSFRSKEMLSMFAYYKLFSLIDTIMYVIHEFLYISIILE